MVEEIKKCFIERSNEYELKYDYNYWDSHVKYVVKRAVELAKTNNANLAIVEISANSHDLAKVFEEREEESHNLVGSELAVQLLSNKKYNKEKIEKVRKCILYHGRDLNSVSLTKEEWCARNADILSMFDNITIFFHNI